MGLYSLQIEALRRVTGRFVEAEDRATPSEDGIDGCLEIEMICIN
jgi:hypothetical protein